MRDTHRCSVRLWGAVSVRLGSPRRADHHARRREAAPWRMLGRQAPRRQNGRNRRCGYGHAHRRRACRNCRHDRHYADHDRRKHARRTPQAHTSPHQRQARRGKRPGQASPPPTVSSMSISTRSSQTLAISKSSARQCVTKSAATSATVTLNREGASVRHHSATTADADLIPTRLLRLG